MPLEILGPVVFVGIAVVVLMVWLLANHPPRLLSAETARDVFLLDYPDVEFSGKWIVAEDQRVALCALDAPTNTVAMVEVLGSKHLTRLITSADVREIVQNGGLITIRLHDFTLPNFVFKAGETDRASVLELLSNLTEAVETPTFDEDRLVIQ